MFRLSSYTTLGLFISQKNPGEFREIDYKNISAQQTKKTHLLTSAISTHSRLGNVLPRIWLVGILSIGWWSGISYAEWNGFQVELHSIPLEEISSGGPPKDGIPALMDPKFLSAKEVDFLSPQDRVLGIQGTHQAKAYPIPILNWHEIVNDTLDTIPVVITYCPLCGTGMGFQRKVGNRLLTFGVSGLLYQSDVLMYDHQTESLWSQITMQAVTGKHVGHHLEPLFLEHTTWSAWRKEHPDTLVLSPETGFTRDYRRDPYEAYARTDQLMFPPARQDDRLSPKEWVLGIEIDGQSKAYPFSILETKGKAFSDSLKGKNYVVCWNALAKSAKVVDQQGKPFPSLMAYWFAWYAFHPDTEIFHNDSSQTRPDRKSLSSVC